MRTRPPARPGARGTERRAQPQERHAAVAERRPPGSEWLYGRHAVRESLQAGRRRFKRLLVARGSGEHPRVTEIAALAARRGLPIELVERERLDTVVQGHHQGVALSASAYPYARTHDLKALAAARAALLALDGVEDPQNVGTLLRSAEATGVALVVIPTDRAAGITPAVVNASAGAVEHLQIVREVNLVRWLERAKQANFWTIGLAGEAGADTLFDASFAPPIVVVVGSEGAGLRRLVRDSCDTLVSIPLVGQIASLNAAVAGSIALYEVLRDSASEAR